jgi:hypothetical protein
MLYASEITKHHSLDLQNPFWMQGLPFRDDPGAPTLIASYLLLGKSAVASALPMIWVFSLAAALSVFVAARVLWGAGAGLIAASLYAVTPMNFDMVSWYGLANVLALVYLPLSVAAIGLMLRGGSEWSCVALLAITVVAIAAAHRLTFLFTAITLALVFFAGVALSPRKTLVLATRTTVLALVLGAGVFVDGMRRTTGAHGLQAHNAYDVTRIQWRFVARDLSWAVLICGALAIVLLVVSLLLRRDNADVILIALALAVLILGYSWIVHFPVAYIRATYYLPLTLTLAIASVLRNVRFALLGFLVLALVINTATRTDALIPNVREFYSYVTPQSLRGLGHLEAATKPKETVVTDGCWAFLAEWLLQRPTLAALDRSQILFAEELKPARQAHEILYEGHSGLLLARHLGIRYALVDPKCTHATGATYDPPAVGRPLYLSKRLVVLDLQASQKRTQSNGG